MSPPGAAASPAYLRLPLAELRRRASLAVEGLVCCTAYPRNCRVNRLANKTAACKTGRYARVASHFPHFGEEDCLRGWGWLRDDLLLLVQPACVF